MQLPPFSAQAFIVPPPTHHSIKHYIHSCLVITLLILVFVLFLLFVLAGLALLGLLVVSPALLLLGVSVEFEQLLRVEFGEFGDEIPQVTAYKRN